VSVLSIPEEHASGLARLQSLSRENASLLRDALASAAARKQSADVSPTDIGPIEGVPESDVEQIVDAISGLHHARAFFETPLNEFLDDVVEAMKSAPNSGFSSTGGGALDTFKERVRGFLNIEELALAAKSNVLRFEHERTLHSLRILTDARPIFGIDVEKPPEAIAIGHMLKIAYHRGGKVEEEFFALDEGDLQTLKKAVQRAELKANSLRTMLAKQLKVISQE
jgi:hypothetical protein